MANKKRTPSESSPNTTSSKETRSKQTTSDGEKKSTATAPHTSKKESIVPKESQQPSPTSTKDFAKNQVTRQPSPSSTNFSLKKDQLGQNGQDVMNGSPETPSSTLEEPKKVPTVPKPKQDNSLSAWLCRIYFIGGLFTVWPIAFLIILPLYLLHIVFGFDRKKELMGYLFRLSNRIVVETNPFWKVGVYYANPGIKNKLPKQTRKLIFVANHQSFMDPFTIISALPVEAKWVAKHVLFNIPFGGWMMRMVGDVPIVFKSKKANNTVTDRDSVTIAMERLRNYLKNDSAVFFFPEGRRTEDPNKFLDWRRGAFVMALEQGADIVPLAVHGTHTMWEVNHTLPKPGKAAIVIGEPISVKGLTLEKDVDFLMEKTKQAVQNLHAQAKKKYKSLKK